MLPQSGDAYLSLNALGAGRPLKVKNLNQGLFLKEDHLFL